VSAEVTLYGARYSTYVRAVLMALETKGVAYELEPIDIIAGGEAVEAYRKTNPFARIPTLRHGAFVLYETTAINIYIDEAFMGPPLRPRIAWQRARMMQIMSMTDAYAYRPLVWDIYVERVSNPRRGKPVNEERVAEALPKAKRYLDALVPLVGRSPFLAGQAPSLADFHVAPVFGYFLEAEEGRLMLAKFPRFMDWWGRISATAPWQRAVGQ
jgi:glutathione S-transferase